MKYENLKNDFREQIINTLKDFATTEQNKNIYAIVFDCDLDNGQIVLRYSNNENFETLKQSWKNYKYMYEPYGQNGLFGLKYNSVGDFPMLRYQYSGLTNNFLDSFYYYNVGDYYGDDELITVIEMKDKILEGDSLKNEIKNILISMIVDIINEIKTMTQIIDFDKDCIIFMCDHDISNDDFERWVRKTNDDDLIDRLAQIMD